MGINFFVFEAWVSVTTATEFLSNAGCDWTDDLGRMWADMGGRV
jgi:hypothetical protein